VKIRADPARYPNTGDERRQEEMSKKTFVIAFMMIAAIGFVSAAADLPDERASAGVAEPIEASAGATEDPALGLGMAAKERAAEEDKYLFVFFYKTDDEQTQSMRTVFDAAMEKVADKANATVIDVTDPAEKAFVDKFKVSRAPMPLVLALAPTGAVTGGFPGQFDEAKLLSAFTSPGSAKCLAALQAGKLVFVCLQNEGTRLNGEAMKGVQDFKEDAKYADATEIITLDPGDPGETDFLKKLKADLQSDSAVTLFMAPPGAVLASYNGGTDKDSLVKALEDALAKSGGCGPGSSPGCCPPKKQGE
jgi:hypothetical protein